VESGERGSVGEDRGERVLSGRRARCLQVVERLEGPSVTEARRLQGVLFRIPRMGLSRLRPELVEALASVEPVRYVPVLIEPIEVEHVERARQAFDRLRDLRDVVEAGQVLVGDEEHAPASETYGVLLSPLPGPSGVRRGDEACAPKALHVLLALDDPHGLFGIRLEELRESIEHAAHPLEPPDPSPSSIGPTLPELLARHTDHLIEQHSALVPVVIDAFRLDTERRVTVLGREVRKFKP
jgi:hypothetical protein